MMDALLRCNFTHYEHDEAAMKYPLSSCSHASRWLLGLPSRTKPDAANHSLRNVFLFAAFFFLVESRVKPPQNTLHLFPFSFCSVFQITGKTFSFFSTKHSPTYSNSFAQQKHAGKSFSDQMVSLSLFSCFLSRLMFTQLVLQNFFLLEQFSSTNKNFFLSFMEIHFFKRRVFLAFRFKETRTNVSFVSLAFVFFLCSFHTLGLFCRSERVSPGNTPLQLGRTFGTKIPFLYVFKGPALFPSASCKAILAPFSLLVCVLTPQTSKQMGAATEQHVANEKKKKSSNTVIYDEIRQDLSPHSRLVWLAGLEHFLVPGFYYPSTFS